MSINVNVTGNPVRIHRGKMVTANADYAKEEFQKRRRMRLEQVRQQSKDIAETVRNKVRNEQSKQLSDMEKRGENELKKWQTRKLLQLQQQYDECLKDIGLGHSEAALEEESDYAMESRKESYDQVARERGHRAAEKLHKQKYQESLGQSAGLQKRSYNQAIENTRAKLVADLNRKKKHKSPFKKKKRKVCTDINISSRLSGGSDTGSEVPDLLDFSSSSYSSSTSKENVKKSTRKDPTPVSKVSAPVSDVVSRQRFAANPSTPKEKNCGRSIFSPTTQKIDEEVTRTCGNCPIDTRISDRIKSRTILSDNCEPHTNNCDISPPATAHRSRKALTIHSDHYSSPMGSPKKSSPPAKSKKKTVMSSEDEDEFPAKCSTSKPCYSNDLEEIPNRPTVTIRTAPESSNQLKSFAQSSGSLNKVQYYDHKNRFTKKYVADNSSVQRIPEESIEVCPSSRSEVEFKEQMFKRDQEAHVRGQKALQKEKVHRDYREMMQQLPVLQKQERVAAIPSKKHTFHMSEDRLKQHEKKKQNRMENAYEKLFPKARVITIPPKDRGKISTSTSTLPFQTIDINDNQPSLNVGSWDIDFKPKFASDLAPKHVESNLIREATVKVLGETTNPEKEAADRKENLQEMLRSLQFHRDKLAKELSSLPESNNLHKLFSELGHIDKLIQIGQNVDKESSSSGRLKRSRSRRKHRSKDRSNKASSSSASPSRLETVREESEKGQEDRKTSKYHIRCTSGSSTSPSPPSKIVSTKRSKSKRKETRPPLLVLQNTSTQTTPTVEKSKELATQQDNQQPMSPKSSTVSANSKPCSKEIGPCECYLHTSNRKSELCEIVIKITEDGKPKVCVGPSKFKDKQIIVKTSEEHIAAVSLEPSSHSPEIEQPAKSISFDTSKSKLSEKLKALDKPKIKKKEQVKQNTIDSRDETIKDKDYKQKCSSWREYLSQNSTSSTSYFSPPDFTSTHPAHSHTRHFQPHDTPAVPKQKSGGHLMNILRDKPQQNNLQDNSSISNRSSAKLSGNFIEPYLLCCVKKLLTMSRRSIDDLTVSSVSEISTPSSSIVNIQSNISTQQLEDFMKHFNINMSDLQEFLNYSPDESNIHYNTAESLTLSPTIDRSRSPNCTTRNDSETAKSPDLRETSFNNYATQNYPSVLAAYNTLAENCAKKIENLAAMIEKVRLEKINILQSPGSGSDKENSTKYMNLPSELRKQILEEDESPSPNSILEQEELDRQLLEIDYSFADRLKKMTPAEIREQYPLNGSNIGNSTANSSGSLSEENDQQRDSIEKDLMRRYKNLLESHKSGAKTSLNENSNCPCPSPTIKDRSTETTFVPVLVDIPRWPKLEVPSMTIGLHRNNEKSKPPPSKGISVARRFNNDINIVPHELSTIAESESLMSSRLHKSKTPESRASSKEASPKRETCLDKDIVPSSVFPKSTGLQPKVTHFTAAEFKPSSSSGSLPSLPDILAELMKNASGESEKAANKSGERSSNKNKTETKNQIAPVTVLEAQSDSSSDLENMEAMLKSLGMGWAITTLRKTQEALALTSSSSSIDISVTRKEMKLTDTSSPSEISVREVLGHLTKLSSTNDSSGSYQFLKELQDLSAIYGSEISQEKTTRRTSTPVQSARSADKSKSDSQPRMTITGESELSSVKVNSDSNNCDYVPFYSLNESSIKSKNSSKND